MKTITLEDQVHLASAVVKVAGAGALWDQVKSYLQTPDGQRAMMGAAGGGAAGGLGGLLMGGGLGGAGLGALGGAGLGGLGGHYWPVIQKLLAGEEGGGQSQEQMGPPEPTLHDHPRPPTLHDHPRPPMPDFNQPFPGKPMAQFAGLNPTIDPSRNQEFMLDSGDTMNSRVPLGPSVFGDDGLPGNPFASPQALHGGRVRSLELMPGGAPGSTITNALALLEKVNGNPHGIARSSGVLGDNLIDRFGKAGLRSSYDTPMSDYNSIQQAAF
jgi:hypothetical protein